MATVAFVYEIETTGSHGIDRGEIEARDESDARRRLRGKLGVLRLPPNTRLFHKAEIAVREAQAKSAKLRYLLHVLAEHHAWLDRDGTVGDVNFNDFVQIFRTVDDQGGTDRLAALRCARAARQYRHAFVSGNLDRRSRRLFVLRNDNADRIELVDGSIGSVAAARKRIKQDFALDMRMQFRCERPHSRRKKRLPGSCRGGVHGVSMSVIRPNDTGGATGILKRFCRLLATAVAAARL